MRQMTAVDGMGFLAAGLVLATFCMKRLVALRVTAISSNLAFILYGHIAGIEPVLVLHLILLPVNLVRLMEALGISLYSAPSRAARRRHPVH
jgi:CRP/FNR family cyclic AMP-dependent transcriptional regulator